MEETSHRERDGIRFRIWGFVSHKMMFQQRRERRVRRQLRFSVVLQVCYTGPNEKGTPQLDGRDGRDGLRVSCEVVRGGVSLVPPTTAPPSAYIRRPTFSVRLPPLAGSARFRSFSPGGSRAGRRRDGRSALSLRFCCPAINSHAPLGHQFGTMSHPSSASLITLFISGAAHFMVFKENYSREGKKCGEYHTPILLAC